MTGKGNSSVVIINLSLIGSLFFPLLISSKYFGAKYLEGSGGQAYSGLITFLFVELSTDFKGAV